MRRLGLALLLAVGLLSACGGPSQGAVAARVEQACRPIASSLGTGYLPEVTAEGFANFTAAIRTAGDDLAAYAAEDLGGDARVEVSALADALLFAGGRDTATAVGNALERVPDLAANVDGAARCDPQIDRERGTVIDKLLERDSG